MLGRRSSRLFWVALLIALAALIGPRVTLVRRYTRCILTLGDAPSRSTAIVFGAGLRRDGTPTQVLADRVATAAALYHQGKVQWLFLSGSTRGEGYDEPEAMRALAIALGVDPQAILMDKQGTRTLETCLRARKAFGIQSALLVTQRFHLPRAMVLCKALGIRADGVQADLSRYSTRSRWLWELRELPASLVAVIDAARLNSSLQSETHSDAEPSDPGAPHGS
jgi:vancomycin permeability regulator SanA